MKTLVAIALAAHFVCAETTNAHTVELINQTVNVYDLGENGQQVAEYTMTLRLTATDLDMWVSLFSGRDGANAIPRGFEWSIVTPASEKIETGYFTSGMRHLRGGEWHGVYLEIPEGHSADVLLNALFEPRVGVTAALDLNDVNWSEMMIVTAPQHTIMLDGITTEFVRINAEPVPEPTTAFLLISGLGAFALAKLKRRS